MKRLLWLLLLAATPALANGYLVESSIEILPPPVQALPDDGSLLMPQVQEYSICRYSDGVVLTVPGMVCPASD
jgi:hypothetical protein